MALQLVIGDRNYSSWSLRAALVLELSGQPFSDIPVALYRPESGAPAQLLANWQGAGAADR